MICYVYFYIQVSFVVTMIVFPPWRGRVFLMRGALGIIQLSGVTFPTITELRSFLSTFTLEY